MGWEAGGLYSGQNKELKGDPQGEVMVEEGWGEA